MTDNSDPYAAAAAMAAYDPAWLRATVDIESGGDVDAWRFEPHAFKRLSGRAAKTRAEAEGLSPRRALEAISWGVGQIMGFNAKLANYADAEAMIRDFETGDDGRRLETQLLAMVAFCENAGLGPAIRSGDTKAFALGYNGAKAIEWGYHAKFVRRLDYWGGERTRIVKTGERGLAVREIQDALKRLGYDVEADGVFGVQTAAAVREFQADCGLNVDGVVGNKTWGALKLAKSEAAKVPPMTRRDAVKEVAQANRGKIEIGGAAAALAAWIGTQLQGLGLEDALSLLRRASEGLARLDLDWRTAVMAGLGLVVVWLLIRDRRRAV